MQTDDGITSEGLPLELLAPTFAVARLDPGDPVPDWAGGCFVSVTRTRDELSIVCEQSAVPAAVTTERGFRGLRVRGQLDFGMTGVLASLAEPLGEAGISIFVVSTYDTDYLLVSEQKLDAACECLRAAGHVIGPPSAG